jgi:hypothetical protein
MARHRFSTAPAPERESMHNQEVLARRRTRFDCTATIAITRVDGGDIGA